MVQGIQDQRVEGGNLARRRYQKGSLILRGNEWIGRWREDVIKDGELLRPYKWEVLGSKTEFPTKRLAQRELEARLSVINSPSYRARPTATFAEFANKWTATVLTQHKRSTQLAIRSQLRTRLLPTFESVMLKDFDAITLQRFIADCSECSPKTVRNLIITLRMMWNSAKAWGFVAHNPFEGLVMPRGRKAEPKFFTLEQMRNLIKHAEEPFKTIYWLASETGMRAGELCGLRPEDLDMQSGVVRVRQSVWRGNTQSPKTGNSIRAFAISSELQEHLRGFLFRKGSDANVRFLFQTRNGTPLDGNLIVKRKLRPLCVKLGIPPAGLHAFRHGNATVMDQLNVPGQVRMARLGHADLTTTFGYTHVIGADDRRIAAQFGNILHDVERPNLAAIA